MDDLNFDGAYDYLQSTNEAINGLNQIQFPQNGSLEPMSFTNQMSNKSKMTIVKIDSTNIDDELLNDKSFSIADSKSL